MREAVSHKGRTSCFFLAASAASCAVTTLRQLGAGALLLSARVCVCATRVAHTEKETSESWRVTAYWASVGTPPPPPPPTHTHPPFPRNGNRAVHNPGADARSKGHSRVRQL